MANAAQDDKCVFVLGKQYGETIANPLVKQLQTDPNVKLATYNIPCPTERIIKLRLELKKGVGISEKETLRFGIHCLLDELEMLEDSFASQCGRAKIVQVKGTKKPKTAHTTV